MHAYEASKGRLFLEYAPRASVIHVGEPAGIRMAQKVEELGKKPIRVSAKADPTCEISVTEAAFSPSGISATLATPTGSLALRSPLAGLHNLENLVVTLGVIHALGLDLSRAAMGLASAIGAPGRLEPVSEKADDITVLVDYAHTPDALKRVLSGCRPFTKGRLLCVFGCGGDRDPTKREPMGRAAAEGADVAIVTSDNPRTEDPMAIVAVVAGAVHRSGLRPIAPDEVTTTDRGYVVFPDRREAIELAIQKARPGDLVLIAGKGHEDYQIIGEEKVHFDDREEARRALAARRT